MDQSKDPILASLLKFLNEKKPSHFLPILFLGTTQTMGELFTGPIFLKNREFGSPATNLNDIKLGLTEIMSSSISAAAICTYFVLSPNKEWASKGAISGIHWEDVNADESDNEGVDTINELLTRFELSINTVSDSELQDDLSPVNALDTVDGLDSAAPVVAVQLPPHSLVFSKPAAPWLYTTQNINSNKLTGFLHLKPPSDFHIFQSATVVFGSVGLEHSGFGAGFGSRQITYIIFPGFLSDPLAGLDRPSRPLAHLVIGSVIRTTHTTPSPKPPSESIPSTPSSLTPSHLSDDELPTFEKPPSPIENAPAPANTTTAIPDYDSDTMPMEAWDGDTDKISAQDFLRVFHRDVKVTTSSADKAKAFKNYLAANSDADDWYQALPAATKLDMDLIDTAAEYGTELLKCKLTKEELGTKVKVADREVWAHHAWGTKMLRLALKAGVSATTTKDARKLARVHRDVDTVELELDMKDWREEKEQRDEVAKLRQALQASPTAGIRAQLTNARLNTPAQASVRWPTPAPGANPFQGSGGGGQGNLFAAPRAPYQTQAPRAPYQPQAPRTPYPPQARPPMTIQPPLEGDRRRILLEAIARIIHYPDTEAGRRAHADQQQEWYRTHGSIEMSINTPYPLRPGRAPVNSGECYRCGIMGHTNYQRRCTATPNERCETYRRQCA
ncbi:hypothetical protein B0H17DRAFT_1146867 [Mycena rosella]|uniref:Uncharacterized protein n=1 Tax=Mycena rosella TaxID=1033263 RepID=A0AAD7CNL7_MYCRO|nr:hypothetical protein B0H17DRAFT_1146867 [Mycena rosella]